MRIVVCVVVASVLLAFPSGRVTGDVQDRVAALVSRMTLEEKVGQLTLSTWGPKATVEHVRSGRLGSVMNFVDPYETAAFQDAARSSRLGIPLFVGYDVVQGYRTLFPSPLGEAAAFDPDLSRLIARYQATEARAGGQNWTFGPMVDVSRDLRWGRVVEGGGEDTYLSSVLAAARVKGYADGGLTTSAKHFAAYGASVGGRDYEEASVGVPVLRDTYLPPFRAAVDAGTESVMTAFTALDGVPAAANPALVGGVLRGEMGFRGFVVSDFNAVGEFVVHGVAADAPEATRLAFAAGVDMDMGSDHYAGNLADEVRAGRVREADVDRAVTRVLRAKVRAGLFEEAPRDPAGWTALPDGIRETARKAARDGAVLLRNEGGVLPLSRSARIAVVGPYADDGAEILGRFRAVAPERTQSILAALRERADGDGTYVTHVAACDVACLDETGFDEAVAAVAASDVAVVVVGEKADDTGEGASRLSLDLPGKQARLVARVAATGRPVVLVVVAGRPQVLGEAEAARAVLMAWQPGSEGGAAVAEVLFGAEPGGRLPVTWPARTGQVPIHYDRLPGGRPHADGDRFTYGFVDGPERPLFPFGHGLSYTSFVHADVRATPSADGTVVHVASTLSNVGSVHGTEVVQVYVRQRVAVRSRPVRLLKAFAKVGLAPGGPREVSFDVSVSDLAFTGPDGRLVEGSGTFDVWVGGSSDASATATFVLPRPSTSRGVDAVHQDRPGGL